MDKDSLKKTLYNSDTSDFLPILAALGLNPA